MKIKYRLPQINLSAFRELQAHFGHYLIPYRGKLLGSLGARIGLAFLALLTPWPIKFVIDYILVSNSSASGSALPASMGSVSSFTLITLAAAAVIAIAALRGLLNYTSEVLSKSVGHRLVRDIRLDLFSHVQRLPQAYHDYRKTGELLTRITGDVGLITDLFSSTIVQMISQAILVVGMFAVMFWIDSSLAWLALLILPVFILAAYRFSSRIRTSARKQRESYGHMVSSVQESIAGIHHTKLFGQESRREKLVSKSLDRDAKVSVKTARLVAHYARIVDIITASGVGLVLWFGTYRALEGAITAGDLVIYLAYVRGVYRPIRGMARQTAKMAKAIARGEKVMELFKMQPEIIDVPSSVSAKNMKGDIEFRDVTFGYVASHPVLTKFSCHIPEGRTTMIIGHTGAGKSTVAKLLLRLYDPDTGSIRIDRNDIRDYGLRSLRKRISPMSQDTYLFRTTISDNIGYGKKRASQDEIVAAARLVGADEFIQTLPDGYDTLVGEGGLTLSGGQRQKVSFARAALRRAPIMIFDEPATGLDVHSEHEAMQVLKQLKVGRSMLIITHRLKFLQLADWIVFMRDGYCVGEGTPDELEAENTAYHEYVHRHWPEPVNTDEPTGMTPDYEHETS